MRISDWSSDGCSSDLPRIAHYVLVEIALSQPACEPRDRAVQDALALRDRPVPEIQARNEKEKRSRRRDTDDAIAEERSDERRVGRACVSTWRSRCWPYHYNNQFYTHLYHTPQI